MEIYNALLENAFFPTFELLLNKHFWKRGKELKVLQYKSKDELEDRSWEKMRSILDYASKHSPFYADMFSKIGIETSDIKDRYDLTKLPILTKKTIRDNNQSIITDAPKNRYRWNQTSGSTGGPLFFLSDGYAYEINFATTYLFNSWCGIKPGDRILYVTNPRPNLKIADRIWNIIQNFHNLSLLDVTGKKPSETVYKLKKAKPKAIYGYTSGLTLLANLIRENGLDVDFDIKSIVCTAETLDPAYEKILKEVFRKPIFNRYGSRELGNIMQDCEEHHGLHINTELAFVEVIKDDGEPAKPGERGKIVVTNLANYVMPLIRYDTGDIGIAGHSCSCDRGFPIVKTIEGRVAEFIFKRSGEPIALPGHFLILGNFIKYINAFQFIQNTFEEVTILVVPNKSYNGEINNKLTKYFENLLGSKVTVMEVEDILAEKSGKKLLVKSKLKLL